MLGANAGVERSQYAAQYRYYGFNNGDGDTVDSWDGAVSRGGCQGESLEKSLPCVVIAATRLPTQVNGSACYRRRDCRVTVFKYSRQELRLTTVPSHNPTFSSVARPLIMMMKALPLCCSGRGTPDRQNHIYK